MSRNKTSSRGTAAAGSRAGSGPLSSTTIFPFSIIQLQLLLSLLLFCTLSPSTGKVIRPSNNPDYNNAASDANGTVQPFTIYQTTTVYVHARDNVTGHEWKATFWPRIDEFSQFELLGTFNNSMIFNPNVTVWVEYQNKTTQPKHVYQNENQLFIPYFTAVVLLDKGRVSDLQWQDGCGNGCRDKYCLDNVCGNFRMDGDTDVCTKIDCNIKVYFAWSGRDASDNACKSIASTPQKFQQYSLTPTANFGTGLWDDIFYKFTSTAPNPIDQQA